MVFYCKREHGRLRLRLHFLERREGGRQNPLSSLFIRFVFQAQINLQFKNSSENEAAKQKLGRK